METEVITMPTTFYEFMLMTGLKLEDAWLQVWVQIVPLISGMVHIIVGALIFWSGGKFGIRKK